jgi:hypothetical protein
MRMTSLAVLPLLLVFAGAARSEDAPKADAAKADSGAGRWVLELQHGRLNTVMITDAAGRTTAYHYVTVKATNKTAFARDWRPKIRAVTDTKPTAPYYALPLANALDSIRKQERDTKLVLLSDTGTKIEPGETKSFVAVFGRLDPAYDRVHVELRGFVNPVAVYKVEKYPGDRTVIVDSAYYERNQKVLDQLRKEARESNTDRLPSPDVEYQEMMEDRVFDIEYSRRGDEYQAEDSMIRFVREGWRVEGEPKLLRVVHKQ